MIRIRKRKCRNCQQFFLPDYRNAKRQHYCQHPECRKASKAESQRKWLNKRENKDYFSGPTNVKRVQQWRKKHPGYWRKGPHSQNALQDPCRENPIEKQSLNSTFMKSALQDSCISQPAVLIGLIAHFTGSALQDDIANTIGRMQQLGNDILYQPNYAKGGQHAAKTSCLSPSHPPDQQPVRLGGSSPGP
jgi:hypothetical protein